MSHHPSSMIRTPSPVFSGQVCRVVRLGPLSRRRHHSNASAPSLVHCGVADPPHPPCAEHAAAARGKDCGHRLGGLRGPRLLPSGACLSGPQPKPSHRPLRADAITRRWQMRAGSTAGMIKPQGMRMMTPRSERYVRLPPSGDTGQTVQMQRRAVVRSTERRRAAVAGMWRLAPRSGRSHRPKPPSRPSPSRHRFPPRTNSR